MTQVTKLTPPVAPKIPHQLDQHQDSRIDNYYWMRDDQRQDPQVIAHLNAENEYSHNVLQPQAALQQQLE